MQRVEDDAGADIGDHDIFGDELLILMAGAVDELQQRDLGGYRHHRGFDFIDQRAHLLLEAHQNGAVLSKKRERD